MAGLNDSDLCLELPQHLPVLGETLLESGLIQCGLALCSVHKIVHTSQVWGPKCERICWHPGTLYLGAVRRGLCPDPATYLRAVPPPTTRPCIVLSLAELFEQILPFRIFVQSQFSGFPPKWRLKWALPQTQQWI